MTKRQFDHQTKQNHGMPMSRDERIGYRIHVRLHTPSKPPLLERRMHYAQSHEHSPLDRCSPFRVLAEYAHGRWPGQRVSKC